MRQETLSFQRALAEAGAAGLQATLGAPRLQGADTECTVLQTGEASLLIFQVRGDRAQKVTPRKGLNKPGPGECNAGQSQAPTSAVLLVGPVPAVVLSVTLPPLRDAVAVLTLELEVAGAAWGFCRVFWGDTHTVGPLPGASVNTAPAPTASTPVPACAPLRREARQLLGPRVIKHTHTLNASPDSCFSDHTSVHLENGAGALSSAVSPKERPLQRLPVRAAQW